MDGKRHTKAGQLVLTEMPSVHGRRLCRLNSVGSAFVSLLRKPSHFRWPESQLRKLSARLKECGNHTQGPGKDRVELVSNHKGSGEAFDARANVGAGLVLLYSSLFHSKAAANTLQLRFRRSSHQIHRT